MQPSGIVKAFPKVKRLRNEIDSQGPVKKLKVNDEVKADWLSGVTIFIIKAGIGKARVEIFEKQIIQNGGHIVDTFSPVVTHVIVDDRMDCDRALRLLKTEKLTPEVELVKSAWLSLCISEKRLLNTTGYSVFIPDRCLISEQQCDTNKVNTEMQNETAALNDDTEVPYLHLTAVESSSERITGEHLETQVMEGEGSDAEETGVSKSDLEALLFGICYAEKAENSSHSSLVPSLTGKWVCARSSVSKKENLNQNITEKLEVLANAYTHQGDKWRALGYSKAINALKSHPKAVSSYEEACAIPGIGTRMADKIKEILESGHLRKLDYIGETVPVMELFCNIWGVGIRTAQMWYQQVKVMAQSINPGLVVMACGSYRRGKFSCGDVDVLITHPDGKSHKGVFNKILSGLKESGFLTDDLVSQEDSGNQKKYLGVCRLTEPGRRHRRLDIIVVPFNEFACALMYFTGSAHFNRSMRAFAKTKRMSLSEHSLNKNVIRKRSIKINPGVPIPTSSEKDIFEQLGLPYREPHERDW
ncbi:DNA polymerase lambda isoform X2 [Protopterus annectens]|uniref:DNA polymerase lambda isoform X2 n=1 Tax=Protopterus annectens TaxID=7888 RepID=UPI001CFA89A1|nr:DNA polymerase lambda isoform X2 [Protopterus annectens]